MFCKWSGLPESLKLRDIRSVLPKQDASDRPSADLSLGPVQASCSWNKENLEGDITMAGRKGK